MEISRIKVIGLTGMSGAGKSTACRIFQKNGFSVVDCDTVAENVLCKNSKCLFEISERFSAKAINEKGELDRYFIANLIFNDKKMKACYERIVFPYITYAIIQIIRREASGKKEFILLDAPTLFESGADKLCDMVVSVVTELKTAKERIKARDNLTENEAIKRLSSQKRANFYIERSMFSIINNEDLDTLATDTEKIIEKIRSNNVNRNTKI